MLNLVQFSPFLEHIFQMQTHFWIYTCANIISRESNSTITNVCPSAIWSVHHKNLSNSLKSHLTTSLPCHPLHHPPHHHTQNHHLHHHTASSPRTLTQSLTKIHSSIFTTILMTTKLFSLFQMQPVLVYPAMDVSANVII